MGIFFTDKVEHRHGSKKVSRKTAKIEMQIKQEELKQLKQQRRQQELEQFQAQQQYRAEQRYAQQQRMAEQQYEKYKTMQQTQAVNNEKLAEVNQVTLDKIQEQQTKLTELLEYKQYLITNKPKQTKLEIFLSWTMLLIIFFTLPTIIFPCAAAAVCGSILNSLDTDFSRHNKEVTRVNNEIKATQKIIRDLGKSVVRGY